MLQFHNFIHITKLFIYRHSVGTMIKGKLIILLVVILCEPHKVPQCNATGATHNPGIIPQTQRRHYWLMDLYAERESELRGRFTHWLR